jgi:anti-anti-sigma regulatory factor
MIIETKDDVVRLSGSLHKNQWITIRAAANLLLHDHPQGIIIDCSELDDISGDGAKTFLEAMRDIGAANARIVVASLPAKIQSVCKTIPGVRSQLPIADSVEEARASLRMATSNAAANAALPGGRRGPVILVPLVADLDLTYGANLASRIARTSQAEIRLTYFLEVARTLPLGAPLLEQERAAQEALDQGMQYVKQLNMTAVQQVERVREVRDGILAAIRNHEASLVVLGAATEPLTGESHDTFHDLVDTLLHRAPCEVVIGRNRVAE